MTIVILTFLAGMFPRTPVSVRGDMLDALAWATKEYGHYGTVRLVPHPSLEYMAEVRVQTGNGDKLIATAYLSKLRDDNTA